MESKDVQYNFQTNLLKASSNPNYDEAIKEWRRLYRESREVSDLPCICNHKIRHCTYMYNVITKFAIIVGSTCYKKFKLSIPMIKNNIYTQILQDVFEKGEYCIIDDIVEYSEKVKLRLEEHYKNSIKHSSLDDLYKISYSITEIINDFKLYYLDDVMVQIQSNITSKEQNLI